MNTAKVIQKQKEVYGIITAMNEVSGPEGNINYSIKDSKSFDYKTSITGKLEGNDTEKEV